MEALIIISTVLLSIILVLVFDNITTNKQLKMYKDAFEKKTEQLRNA